MADHITKLSQVCFFHMCRIRVVRHPLTRSALLTLVHAFVCSRLDFCNSAMFGIYSYLLDRLQSILNAAARLILQIPKFGSISSAIRDELHWLPVRSRIIFKAVPSRAVAAWPVQLRPISPNFVSRFLPSLVVVKICARHPRVPLWYQGSGQNDTVDGVSPFRAHTCGTHYRQEFAFSSRSQISSRENLNII